MTDLFFYLLIGAFAGSMSGLLGVGGGLVVVPALVLVFRHLGMPPAYLMHMAAGTSLAIMIVTTFSALLAHLGKQASVWPILQRLLPGVVIGTIVGALLADQLASHVLRIVLGVFILIVGMRVALLVKPKPQRTLPGRWGLWGVAFFIGAKSGLLGIGGGAVTVPFLTRCNVPLRDTMGISVAVGFVVSVVGTLSFLATGLNEPHLPPWSTGYVYWPGFLGVALATPIFAAFGTRMAYRLPTHLLKRIFGVFLWMVGLHLLFF